MFPGQILAVPHIFKVYFIEVWLIHSIVSISAVKQSASVVHTHTHTHIYILFHILFHMVYHRILNVVSWTLE